MEMKFSAIFGELFPFSAPNWPISVENFFNWLKISKFNPNWLKRSEMSQFRKRKYFGHRENIFLFLLKF